MRIDSERFKEGVCKKCKQYTGDKPEFGKCQSAHGNRLNCASMRMFNSKEFEEWTGISLGEEE